jgi:hypothetical protein
MYDREVLQWLRDRLVIVHDENPNFDYIHKLDAIIRHMDPKQLTPNNEE